MSYNPIRHPAGTPEAEAAIAKAEIKRARKAAKARGWSLMSGAEYRDRLAAMSEEERRLLLSGEWAAK